LQHRALDRHDEPSFGFTVASLDLAVTHALQRVPRDQVPIFPIA
jgi:hypothetical protein